ncbi:MAG TPA: histidine kinase dimerization/phospho-acceptor domain-containing protein, partial [Methanobacterium sp.]
MVTEHIPSKTKDELVNENFELKSRLDEAEQTLNAIQNGEIDAIITPQGSDGPKVYTLESADTVYRNLIEEMGEGVATLTNTGTIFYANAQLASMLQVPLDKIIGLRFNDFILPEDLGIYWAIFENGLETKSKGEINIKSVDGVILPVHISINTLNDLNGVYVVITDLSEQKHREELNESLIKLERSNAELRQFAYVASHDLREPLRMITSFLQLLERRYKDQLDDDANEFIGFAVDGAKRLDDMIKDILEYSKVTNKTLEYKLVDTEYVLEETLASLKMQIDENHAIITHDPLPSIYADEQLLIQLFQNLISNAIKYHGKETTQIHIYAQKDEN